MEIKRFTLISNSFGYGLFPAHEEEVEQRLTVNCKGEVRFTGYQFGDGSRRRPAARRVRLSIGKAAAADILSLFSRYFQGDGEIISAPDAPTWDLEITDMSGGTKKFGGPLCGDPACTALSEFIREKVPIENLFLFDGDCDSDKDR